MISNLLDRPKNHIVALDVFRALAIIMVFLNHSAIIFQNNGGAVLPIFRFPLIHSGWSGVQLFFVLSGYLIGFQLWKELKATSSINFKTFFIKRTFRIWPLFYFICFAFLILRGNLREDSYFSDLYFLSNYLNEGVIKGSWSLSVEEQFYLISPLLLYVSIKYFKLGLDRVRYILYFLFLCAPIIRFLTLKISLGSLNPSVSDIIDHIYMPIHTNYDSLIVGLILSNYKIQKINLKLKEFIPKLLVALAALAIARFYFKNLFNYSLLAVMFGGALWIGVLKDEVFKRYFNFRIISLIAKLSFGIYLWHYQIGKWLYPIVLNIFSESMKVTQYFVGLLVFFVSVLIISSISYLLIEKPALNYRDKFI